jgi:UDP-N-acetylmuramoyl-tripeptide--D-alanyl-D-alanine ligase
MGRLAATLGLEALVTVGDMAAEAATAAEEAGLAAKQVARCSDHSGAAEALRRLVPEGGWILVKGSRGSAMERVVELLGHGEARD